MPNPLANRQDEYSCCPWQYLPDSLLLHIFRYLSPRCLLNSSQTCHHWHQVAIDEFLWKAMFSHWWKVEHHACRLAPGKMSWLSEFKRLYYHTPLIECEVLRQHRDQVLHVSFSHDGKLFSTCSKDGYVKVWNVNHPTSLQYYADMREFTWKYTQFSQFNQNDTLLLVSGVHFGAHSTSGEIAVFNLVDGFELQCRVLNKPYDIFGTWYNENYLLSGNLHWLGSLTSCSVLWLNKAYQALESEQESVVMRLFKFHNVNASSMRTIMIANCHDTVSPVDSDIVTASDTLTESHPYPTCSHCGLVLSDTLHLSDMCGCSTEHGQQPVTLHSDVSVDTDMSEVNGAAVSSTQQCNEAFVDIMLEVDSDPTLVRTDGFEMSPQVQEVHSLGGGGDCDMLYDCCDDKTPSSYAAKYVDVISSRTTTTAKVDSGDKYLIFTTGLKTYTPHQIGVKRIRSLEAERKMNMPRTARSELPNPALSAPPFHLMPDIDENQGLLNQDEPFDSVDHLIELHGHIIGMCLTPDHRYLYVNCRAWPQGYHIDNPLSPPPIAQEIDIHVIDLWQMCKVETILHAHKAYTPNDECFFIFLDASHQYVASGAEDKFGYMWDRHYGVFLAKFQHADVVNSVAFNPQDPEMLVTVSDDHAIKIWRSRHQMALLKGKVELTDVVITQTEIFNDS